MSDWRSSIGRDAKAGAAALWLGAAIVVVTVHVAAGALLLQEEDVAPADVAPPAAIMIDLAEVAEAVSTEENSISPDEVTTELAVPSEKVETSEVTPPEEVSETQPDPSETVPEDKPDEIAAVDPQPVEPVSEEVIEPDAVEEDIEPIEEDPVVLPDVVEVPILSRPKPPVKKEPAKEKAQPSKVVERRPAKPAQQQDRSAKPATKAQAQVKQSNRNAARQSASGRSASISPARWQSKLMAHLERRKRYPRGARSRGEQGIVRVRFRIDESGNVLSVSLSASSGFPDLDNEILSLVRRASPVPAPPPGTNKTITAPFRFSTRD
jgi:protein TonB